MCQDCLPWENAIFFSDHGANRLGASALMQGLADGYFVIPYTIGPFLSGEIRTPAIKTDAPEFEEAENATRARLEKLMSIGGSRSVESFHRELGLIMWDYCGMSRNAEVEHCPAENTCIA